MLVRLLYASRAAKPIGTEVIESILAQSRKHNPELGVTGILCQSGDVFMQVLEGGRTAVNQLYNQIVRDERHHDVIVLHYEEIGERQFVGWTMGRSTSPRSIRWILQKTARCPPYNPFAMSWEGLDGPGGGADRHGAGRRPRGLSEDFTLRQVLPRDRDEWLCFATAVSRSREDLGLARGHFDALERLDTPQKIQAFLNRIPANHELGRASPCFPRARCCASAGRTASRARWWPPAPSGSTDRPPLLVHLDCDTLRLSALHRGVRQRRYWGAISKTRWRGAALPRSHLSLASASWRSPTSTSTATARTAHAAQLLGRSICAAWTPTSG